jgi:GH25 family lysozyme M1 (1,4-beta-N-acetylmuramidase)
MLVVDVSYHNGVIDWKKAKDSGVVGAIIRCGYGRDFTKYDDSKYRANMDGALSVGIKVGVYLYSYAKTIESAKSEAAHALRLVDPYKSRISLPIYYDLEEPGTESGAKERAIAFGEILEARGYTVGVYANEYWWKNYLKGLDRFTKWVAKWGSVEPQGFSNMELWQYDAYGRVNGIGSGVDLDKPYGKIAEMLSGKDPVKEDKVMIELSVLRKGSKGSEVFTVQSVLKAEGYKGDNGKVLALDKSFGANTEYAVKSFQRNNGLAVDGIVGAKTWDKLLKG